MGPGGLDAPASYALSRDFQALGLRFQALTSNSPVASERLPISRRYCHHHPECSDCKLVTCRISAVIVSDDPTLSKLVKDSGQAFCFDTSVTYRP